jgi:hypothetical protein
VEDVFSASTSSTLLPLEIVNTHHPIGSIRDANASQLINLQVEPEWKQSDYPDCAVFEYFVFARLWLAPRLMDSDSNHH